MKRYGAQDMLVLDFLFIVGTDEVGDLGSVFDNFLSSGKSTDSFLANLFLVSVVECGPFALELLDALENRLELAGYHCRTFLFIPESFDIVAVGVVDDQVAGDGLHFAVLFETQALRAQGRILIILGLLLLLGGHLLRNVGDMEDSG